MLQKNDSGNPCFLQQPVLLRLRSNSRGCVFGCVPYLLAAAQTDDSAVVHPTPQLLAALEEAGEAPLPTGAQRPREDIELDVFFILLHFVRQVSESSHHHNRCNSFCFVFVFWLGYA